MFSHDHHPELPGYHPDQILHDGCEECERRSKEPSLAISQMDAVNFEKAWQRTSDWNRGGVPVVEGKCRTELPIINVLWAIMVQLEQRGLPIDQVPGVLPETYSEAMS